MKSLLVLAAMLAIVDRAGAVPRFAARNGGECIQCHISPTGGGVRNAYGRNVFARLWLPRGAGPSSEDWVTKPGDDPGDDDAVAFSPEINKWMTLGGDLRAAYILIEPEHGTEPGTAPDTTSSFFLMQADLYHAMTLNAHVTTVIDVGAYSGFEAWALYHLKPEHAPYNLMLRVGKFMPAFGIREVEHQLFTRQSIGLGATDRDTGLELTGYAGPVTANVAVLNGTLGDTAFDNHGKERRTFEKAIASRLSARADLGWVRGQLGLSLYYNQNGNAASPLFGPSIPSEMTAEIGQGVDEVRAGGFAMMNLGRFTYLADLVVVRDRFYSRKLSKLAGYASYQELSFLPTQGVDLVGTFEFADPDVDLVDNAAMRAGFAVEVFPWSFTELRAMVRKTWDDASPTGGAWDVVVFSHLFF